MDIQKLKRLLRDTLKNDAPLRALMGGTTDDPRIYPYYRGDAVISTSKPAYITYAMTANSEYTQAVGQPVLSVAIWALNTDSANAVRNRVVALLGEDSEVALTSGDGVIFRATRVGERDSYQENTQFTGINLQFEFGFSRV